MLTFDDGFKDHINYVLPELKKRKIMACFFPPAKPILNQTVLDTHLIHFILEKTVDFKKLNLKLFELLKQHSYSNDDIEKFCKKYSFRNKFDNEEISFFKRMLQKVLPLNLRNKITKIIFEEKFDKSIGDLSKELYLNKKDLIQMLNEGMIIGSHSYNHFWLDTLSKEEQSEDLDLSINFLKDLGAITKDWMMCYPFGAYNNDTIDLLKSKKCSFAFTTNSGLADLTNDPYKLKGKDTTEFPQ